MTHASYRTGRGWLGQVVAGALGIARGQIRQKLGMSPGHPVAPSPAAH